VACAAGRWPVRDYDLLDKADTFGAMSVRGRFAIAAIVLYLTSSASPSTAILLCVSDSGGTAIELAAPGTTRCCDRSCEPVAAQPGVHTCHDIPVLSAGDSVAKTADASVRPHVTLHVATPQPARTSTGVVMPIRHVLPPTLDALARHSIVLTL